MKTTDPQFRALLKDVIPVIGDVRTKKDAPSNRLKTFFKRWPKLYMFLRETFGPTHSPWNGFRLHRRVHALFRSIGMNAVILNLGAGPTRLHPDIINVDILPLKDVDLVADIGNLPLRNATVDGIVCDSVLEHLENTSRALSEMSRVMKPGGTLYITALFLYPYHSSPDDFYRWTEQGIRRELRDHGFAVKELGIRGGPMGTLQGILMHVFAAPFSPVSQVAYFLAVQFFMVLFSPLKLLDPLYMRFARSIEAASDMYVVAQKK